VSSDPAEIVTGGAADLADIVAVLNQAAADSIASFDTQPIEVAQRRDWLAQFGPSGPHRLLVARRGGRFAGYAASQPYRDHPAFDQTVEVSITLASGCRGQGVGTALYRELFAQLSGEPVHVALAGIALPNDASVALHRKFGFTDVGVFREYAVKHGQYLSSLWLQRHCG
jgi:phosphinothricin acetyltransferase